VAGSAAPEASRARPTLGLGEPCVGDDGGSVEREGPDDRGFDGAELHAKVATRAIATMAADLRIGRTSLFAANAANSTP
jgi:hypothetical protein